MESKPAKGLRENGAVTPGVRRLVTVSSIEATPMKVSRVRISTLILLIAIIALSLALAIQGDRASRREAVLQRRLKQMATEVRDGIGRELRIREDIVLGLLRAGRSKSDPQVKTAISEMQKTQTELRASLAQLKGLP